jgi:hypothetical protein
MVRRLTDPYVRSVLTAAGYAPGTVTDLHPLAEALAGHGYFLTRDLAADPRFGGPRPGWNLRCNRCGTYGATWTGQRGSEAYRTERPGWGALALCQPHHDELDAEYERHRRALDTLRHVRYEQEPHR